MTLAHFYLSYSRVECLVYALLYLLDDIFLKNSKEFIFYALSWLWTGILPITARINSFNL